MRRDGLNNSGVISNGTSLEANLILCHILVHVYLVIGTYIRRQKTTAPTAGLRALLQDAHRRLQPAPGNAFAQPSAQLGSGSRNMECDFDKILLKIENILGDFELQLPKDYSDTIKNFIELIRKDARGAKR